MNGNPLAHSESSIGGGHYCYFHFFSEGTKSIVFDSKGLVAPGKKQFYPRPNFDVTEYERSLSLGLILTIPNWFLFATHSC